MKEKDGRVYLVRETKASADDEQMRGSEGYKVRCGRRHFKELPGVVFSYGPSPHEI